MAASTASQVMQTPAQDELATRFIIFAICQGMMSYLDLFHADSGVVFISWCVALAALECGETDAHGIKAW